MRDQIFLQEAPIAALTSLLGRPDVALAAFVLCAAIAIAAAAKVIADLRRRPAVQDGCPWTRDKSRSDGDFHRWVCDACGGISFVTGDDAPITCRKYEPRGKL